METGLGSQPFSQSIIRCNYYYCFLLILQVQLIFELYSAPCKICSLCSENMGLWQIPAQLETERGSEKVKIMVKTILFAWISCNSSDSHNAVSAVYILASNYRHFTGTCFISSFCKFLKSYGD